MFSGVSPKLLHSFSEAVLSFMLCNKPAVGQVLLRHTSIVWDSLLQKMISCGLFWLLLPVTFPKFSCLLCFPGWKTADQAHIHVFKGEALLLFFFSCSYCPLLQHMGLSSTCAPPAPQAP